VLSYQRRIAAFKLHFLKRIEKTPLGILRDWWDRTEAQNRAALHAHILIWLELRAKKDGYKPLAPIPRTVPGMESRQRPLDKKAVPLKEHQEDNMYHQAHANRISTEMARPFVGDDLAGYDVEKLRVAGLARCVQTKLCLHTCSTKYCLLNRSTCRFFFPSGA